MGLLISTNPARNFEVLGQVPVSPLTEIQEKISLARNAFHSWKELGIDKRIVLLKPIFQEFQNNKEMLAKNMALEIGKPIVECRKGVETGLKYFNDFLDNGAAYLQDETKKIEGTIHHISFEPFGVAAVISPWNFPFGSFIWGVIPNLIAGNTVVFKHSEECPLYGEILEKLMKKGNLPKGVFSEIYGDATQGAQLLQGDITLIWFTGSTRAGQAIYQIAAGKFVKVLMELGGSNPAIVFEDADIGKAVPKLVASRFTNAGQFCDAAKRLIVHESRFDELVEKLAVSIQEIRLGDPLDEKTTMGSLVAKRQVKLLESQVKDAIQKGAKIVTGGKKPGNLKGAYFEPTILVNIKPTMRVWKEEVFGPVLPIVSFKTETEAIRLANDTEYGLGAEIYTANPETAKRVAGQIDAGFIEINQANHWHASNPFGGFKKSGMGRELGKYGFQELCQIKLISE
ncbi:MAG: aldehyde dehydrogenase family protein [Candidatus ainarchaeum sp.]|nr:aldehyde dehydrogenase family protein [Candidatus ainarchaeum sp.]